jgi:cellulose synthase/poly-beta-1,6-N-acetylglucosamine synthase-like glycosyltransferase
MSPTNIISLAIRLLEYFFHIHLLMALISYGVVAGLLRKHFKHIRIRAISHEKVPFERFNSPKVIFIIPTFNEGAGILDSVEAALSADYPNFQVMVVDDGSSDDTISQLNLAYALEPKAFVTFSEIKTASKVASYQSKSHPNLVVITKEHSGKADSLNLAINHCDSELICCIDADSIITPDALRKMVIKFVDEPQLIALGGTISPSNEIIVQKGEVIRRKSDQPIFVAIQIIEYLR